MSRMLVIAAAVVVALVAILFLLAGRATERPLARVEKVVTLENLQK